MANKSDLEQAFRRFLVHQESATAAAISASSSALAGQLDQDMSSAVTEHASQRTGVHGAKPGMYVALTSRGDGRIALADIVGEWDLSQFDIDWDSLRLAANQIDRGTFVIARLPVAASGENSASKVVRADDIRLATHQMTAEAAEPLYAGMFITMRDDGRCEPASSASEDTAAVGFVTDSFTVGQTAQIFTYGQNPSIYLPLILSSQVLHPFYLGATPGYATMTMPTSGIEQQLGMITSLVSTTIARGMVVIQKATAFVGV